jgi:WD40 repeat protein
MLRRLLFTVAVGAVSLSLSACNDGLSGQKAGKEDASATKDIGNDLYGAPAGSDKEPEAPARHKSADPVHVYECRLSPFEKEEVPALKDGALDFIATEIKPGEEDKVPKEKKTEVVLGKDEKGQPIKKVFRKLEVGDTVEAGQLLAMLDARQARADLDIKIGKVTVARKDEQSADKTKGEAHQRYLTQKRLEGGGVSRATSLEDVRAAELVWQTKTYEYESKRESVALAALEQQQAQVALDYHEIRSSIPGQIRMIYKKRGEAVKALEPVFQILNPNKLRAEGLMDIQHVSRLYNGGKLRPMKAVVETALPEGSVNVFTGHLQDITGVAVGLTRDHKPVIVSCSEDGTLRLWDRETGKGKTVVLPERGVGRALACTGPASSKSWCVCGGSDGIARLWDLDQLQHDQATPPAHELKGQHHGAITSVAFSPNGEYVATGGDDRQIFLWETATGNLRYQFPAGHRGTVTSLQLAWNPDLKAVLVSAARDNTLRIWKLGEKGARLERSLESRSGDVLQLGVSPDGRRALFDQGKTLHLLARGETAGSLQIPSGTAGFTAFALFSPDGRLVATAGGVEGRLQLWRAPDAAHTQGSEIRQLGSEKDPGPKFAAFSPDPQNTFLVSAGSRQLFVWNVPSKEEVSHEIPAEVTLVEKFVESSSGQVRVWAELKNTDGRLSPNSTVTLVIDPE